MTEVYKIFNGKHDEEVTSWLRSRQSMRVITTWEAISSIFTSLKYIVIIRKFNFGNRVVLLWNSLPEAVVCADSVASFKNRLDKFWQDQEVLYNFKAGICTGSRSQVSAILD